MSIYPFGLMVKQRREELGYTQEELADGICSAPTLSRIENGERMPTKEHLEMLLQRLGYSDATYDISVDGNAFTLHELKFQIRQALISNQYANANELLDAYESQANPNSKVAQQFSVIYRTIADPTLSDTEKLERLEATIALTCPQYSRQKFPTILSYEEIIALNNIAVYSYNLGKLDNAIHILYSLKGYYESGRINAEEILRTQPMILYNLSKFLGCASRLDECIDVCCVGIRTARETGRCQFLAQMLYNQAWALEKRRQGGDLEQAEESVNLALCMAKAMNQQASVQHYQNFINRVFGG